jgi:hypothetical protein
MLVPLRRRDRHRERDQVEAPPYGFIHRSQPRFVVAGDNELEHGLEFKEVLPHEPGRNLVATGKGLDAAFCPSAALLGFRGRYQPGSAQRSQLGRVPVVIGSRKRLDWRGAVIVTCCRRNRVRNVLLPLAPNP